MGSTQGLAEYLRARRALVRPAAVGFTIESTPRRVPGLRRQEIASLIGVSPDYYLRMEQGRELHPSTRVLEGLVLALDLDVAAAAHLYRLAGPGSEPILHVDRAVQPGLVPLIRTLWATPLHVLNSHLDVIYVNALASALQPHCRAGTNLLRLTFGQGHLPDSVWRTSTARVVAFLRSSLDPDDDSPELAELVDDLSAMSPRFVELWRRHDVMTASGFPVFFPTEDLGTLELRFHALVLPGTAGQMLGLYSPTPGGPSETALKLLSSTSATREPSLTSRRVMR